VAVGGKRLAWTVGAMIPSRLSPMGGPFVPPGILGRPRRLSRDMQGVSRKAPDWAPRRRISVRRPGVKLTSKNVFRSPPIGVYAALSEDLAEGRAA